MSSHSNWIDIVDRDGTILLLADGPHDQYGVPLHITIRRYGPRYHVRWVEEGEGAGPPASGQKKDLDRAALDACLAELLPSGRPVEELGG